MTTNKSEKRTKRHSRIRARVIGTSERPRLAVFKSNRQLYAQVIDDSTGTTLAAAHSMKTSGKTPREKAEAVAREIAKAAQVKGVTSVVFDRGGFLYTGNVKLFADTAREAGLKF
ncbi:MAG: 50S ribosomal protein L18 [Candidatus Paceibacterota bacterium]